MGFGLVTFPSIKIVLLRDFYFYPSGIFPFGMSRPAASPDGGEGAVADPLWDRERDGNDYPGVGPAQLLGCRHARCLGIPQLAGCPQPRLHRCHQELRGLTGWQGWFLNSWTCALWPLRECACLQNPSWEGIFEGTVFLLALLCYSVFQLLLGEKEKVRKL